MKPNARWQYNETVQVGTDYQDISNVQAYDEQMAKIRDFEKEATDIVNAICLEKEHSLLEIGTGTGSFAIEAAKHCNNVYAIDVSPAMIAYAKQKAQAIGISNIAFFQAGFLSYEHNGYPLDTIVSNLALHHLPDFWKMIALKRIYQLLKNGGTFYLGDVIFSFPIEEYNNKIDNWIDTMKEKAGINFAKEAEMHIKDEFSTFDWVIEEMLHKSGFKFDIRRKDDFFAVYHCKKRKKTQ
ncbi:MAG: methyltransferase domain-containing protein [Candidatus Methanoperedens sp.]|nr:methyltransferase domain-containing protein [Candidatus Methanoperedens sp.]